jgi:hypothetical protein
MTQDTVFTTDTGSLNTVNRPFFWGLEFAFALLVNPNSAPKATVGMALCGHCPGSEQRSILVDHRDDCDLSQSKAFPGHTLRQYVLYYELWIPQTAVER